MTLRALILLLLTVSIGHAERPNIVVFFSDDQGVNDLSCYGSEIPTPHIDSLATEGLMLTQFYAASSICTPSRYGFLTGRNPSRSKDRLLSALMFLEEEDASRGLHRNETTIASVLSENGYDTALIGKWHLGHGQDSFFANKHGFRHTYGHTAGCIDFFTMSYGNTPDWYRNSKLLDETGYATDLITDEAVGFINSRDVNKPFFLFLPYNAPHFGKGWDDKNNTTVNLLQPHPHDLKRVKFIKDPTRRKYAAMVVALDDAVGRVLNAIENNGIRKNTLVIFMTDHGGDPNYGGSNSPLRGNKASLFEGGLKVPCLIRWPGKIQHNSVCHGPVWALDWFPTFCELADINTDNLILDGENITPILDGTGAKSDREFFWELGKHGSLGRGTWTALRSKEWKYVFSNKSESHLFNLKKDPNEENDLSENYTKQLSKMKKRAAELSKKYLEFSQYQ